MFSDIVFISGMPRSGTTWLSQIFASHPDVRLKLDPLFSYAFKAAMDSNASEAEWQQFFRSVYETSSEYLDQEHLRKDGLVPLFAEKNTQPSRLAIKSIRFHHLTPVMLEKCMNLRWVAIVRNPCAAIHSWLSNPLEFPATADPLEEWRHGRCRMNAPGEYWGFEAWKEVTSMFLDMAEAHPDRFRVLRHETLMRSATEQIRSTFAWLGLSVPAQTMAFIGESQSSHQPHKRSVYKRPEQVEAWRAEIDPAIRDAIETELTGTRLERFLHDDGTSDLRLSGR